MTRENAPSPAPANMEFLKLMARMFKAHTPTASVGKGKGVGIDMQGLQAVVGAATTEVRAEFNKHFNALRLVG